MISIIERRNNRAGPPEYSATTFEKTEDSEIYFLRAAADNTTLSPEEAQKEFEGNGIICEGDYELALVESEEK